MITVITGLPGNGKTLYALSFVKEWAERENRPVFYSGINELSLPWTEIDAEKWFDCPARSIIVIDECQRVFRPRAMTRDVPEHVAKLETHRHMGVDIVLITQNPMLMDTAVRRLAGRHFHVMRKFGGDKARIHEWAQVKENCDKEAGRKDSIKHEWKYNKEVYGWYKSAEVHTVKKKIPLRIFLMFALIPVAFLFLGYVYYYFSSMGKPKQQAAQTQVQQSRSAPSSATGKNLDPVEDARQYVFNETPRVVGLPHTAPKYDELTKPSTAPVPAACIESKTKCTCYSQQATPIEVTYVVCHQIVHNGYFQDFDADQRRRDQVQRNAAVLDRDDGQLPLSHASTSGAVLSGDGYGALGKRGPGVNERDQDKLPVSAFSPGEDQPRPRVPQNSKWRAS